MDKRVAGIAAIAAVLIVVFAGASLTGFFSLPKAEEEIRIGFLIEQTGKYAVGGEEAVQGLLLAEKEINDNGGVNGKKIRVIIEDDKSDVADSISAYNKMVKVDGVEIIIGNMISEIALAVSPLAEKDHVLFMPTLATTSKLNDAGEYIFKFQAGNEWHAEKISEAMQGKGFETLALIHANTEYCQDYAGYLNSSLGKKGITVVASELYETTDLDTRTQLLKISAANPEAIHLCGFYEDQGRVLKQARELGIEKQFFSVTTVENQKLVEIAGEAAEGLIYTSSSFDCGNATGFCQGFEEMFGKKPSYRSAYLYDALYAIAKAIEKAGSGNAEKVKEALLDIQFEGAAGMVKFDENGNAKREFALKTVRDGEFVPYGTQ